MKRIVSILAIFALLLMVPLPVHAESESESLQDTSRSGSLSLTLTYGVNQPVEALTDVSVGVVQAASLQAENGAVTYTTDPVFKSLDIAWDSMDAASSMQTAEELEAIVQKQNLPFVARETNQQGKVSFQNLEPGMYLVFQTKEATVNERYEWMRPFLVSVPSLKNGIWEYDVKVEPKASLIRIPPQTIRPPITGMDTHQNLVRTLLIGSLICLAILYFFYRRSKKNSEK